MVDVTGINQQKHPGVFKKAHITQTNKTQQKSYSFLFL